jgi:hypothetical protein
MLILLSHFLTSRICHHLEATKKTSRSVDKIFASHDIEMAKHKAVITFIFHIFSVLMILKFFYDVDEQL